MTYEMTISMDATKGQYLPQLFQLRKKLTRTKCASEKELINTQGAASLDSPSYQGEPGIGAGHGAHVRRGEGKDGRTCPTGLRSGKGESRLLSLLLW